MNCVVCGQPIEPEPTQYLTYQWVHSDHADDWTAARLAEGYAEVVQLSTGGHPYLRARGWVGHAHQTVMVGGAS